MNQNSVSAYLHTYRQILARMEAEMTGVHLTDSISENFIIQMLPHHRAAIDMSRNVLEYTDNRTLSGIARQIITEQTASIENMQRILPDCAQLQNTETALCHFQCRMDSIIRTMFQGMNRARATDRIDCDFIREMIPHHMGAVAMSQNALRYPICSGLRPVLEAIIRSQERGIRQMRCLSNQLGCRQ